MKKYRNLSVCVALSGGRDSMALLHYLSRRGAEYGITLSAVNFNHNMRGESSKKDSGFVADYCRANGIPLLFFEWEGKENKTESSARAWRLDRYAEAVLPRVLENGEIWRGADAVATAHHLNDNAETVLFNLARGSGLSGLTGIGDAEISRGGTKFRLIRPLAGVSRAEIDRYVAENSVPYVDDETNFSSNYTRNKIRIDVLPALESAVPGAAEAIYRFSRLAAEDESFFSELIKERGILRRTFFGHEILRCNEKPLFKRAVLAAFGEEGVRDYNCGWLETLYSLQFAEKGKKFYFAGRVAYCEEGKIAICIEKTGDSVPCVPFEEYKNKGAAEFCGMPLYFGGEENIPCAGGGRLKILRFDPAAVPAGAVVRFPRAGDKFKKFGGGEKNLGSYFTDLKIPVRLRGSVPVVACGSKILIVCGVEISDCVKVVGPSAACCAALDYTLYGR